jgi:hypothetical protein
MIEDLSGRVPSSVDGDVHSLFCPANHPSRFRLPRILFVSFVCFVDPEHRLPKLAPIAVLKNHHSLFRGRKSQKIRTPFLPKLPKLTNYLILNVLRFTEIPRFPRQLLAKR